MRHIGAVVDELAPRVAEAGEGRFAIFGHSMGALVAFELARRLRALGGPTPLALLVAGMGAPHCPPSRPPARHLPDDEFIVAVDRYGGLPAAVLESDELLELVLPALRADFEAAETYRYVPGEPLDVPIVAAAGVEDAFVPDGTLEAWADHTSVGCEARRMPGGHFFLHERPELAEFLAGRLQMLAAATPAVS
jgi:medium-chain acyl-[acyl-carrier-protein] hydrolase